MGGEIGADLVEDEVDGGDVLLAQQEAALAAHLHEAVDVHVLRLAASAEACKLEEHLAQLGVGTGLLAGGRGVVGVRCGARLRGGHHRVHVARVLGRQAALDGVDGDVARGGRQQVLGADGALHGAAGGAGDADLRARLGSA